LRAVLFALRDRLAPTEAAHLAAQMPTLIRGIYYEGYRPADKPKTIRSRDEFLASINAHLKNVRPIDSADAARAVFKVIQRHIAKGEIEEVKQALPQDIRELFPQ
jgi:uncharacterized protein (DUF2267 family)